MLLKPRPAHRWAVTKAPGSASSAPTRPFRAVLASDLLSGKDPERAACSPRCPPTLGDRGLAMRGEDFAPSRGALSAQEPHVQGRRPVTARNVRVAFPSWPARSALCAPPRVSRATRRQPCTRARGKPKAPERSRLCVETFSPQAPGTPLGQRVHVNVSGLRRRLPLGHNVNRRSDLCVPARPEHAA